MDAVVNLKMTPSEFDLMRRALNAYQQEQHKIVSRHSDAPSLQKNAARKEAFLAGDLLKKVA